MKKWIRVPVIEPMRLEHLFEHTPVDYYRYGQYPCWTNPPGRHPFYEPRTEWKLADTTAPAPGQKGDGDAVATD